jgi:DNA-binding CsgD family transcriptional regulator
VLGEGSWAQALRVLLVLGGGGSAERRVLFHAALRQVDHALALDRRLAGTPPPAAPLDRTAGALPCGLLLLDAGAGVLFASEQASALLRHRRGVQLDGGRLRSLRGLEGRGLPRALSRLLAAPCGAASALCIELPAEGPNAPLRLLLLRAAADTGAAGTVLALAFTQQGAATPAGCGLLRDVYGLSAAEAELASLLMSGQNLGEAARSRSVTMNTAKSQLRNVLRKTGSRNQAELMRTLIVGPAGMLRGLGGSGADAPAASTTCSGTTPAP